MTRIAKWVRQKVQPLTDALRGEIYSPDLYSGAAHLELDEALVAADRLAVLARTLREEAARMERSARVNYASAAQIMTDREAVLVRIEHLRQEKELEGTQSRLDSSSS